MGPVTPGPRPPGPRCRTICAEHCSKNQFQDTWRYGLGTGRSGNLLYLRG
jgi:hypothetical protein